MEREFICQVEYFCSDRNNCSDMKEEIIRCRDCLYWKDEDYCLHWQTSKFEAPCTFPEDFCSYAERRAD